MKPERFFRIHWNWREWYRRRRRSEMMTNTKIERRSMENFNRLHDWRLAKRACLFLFFFFYLDILLLLLSVSTISRRTFNVQLSECVYARRWRRRRRKGNSRLEIEKDDYIIECLHRLMRARARFCSFDRLDQPSVVVFVVIITHKSVPKREWCIDARKREKSAWVRKNAQAKETTLHGHTVSQ